MTSRYKVNKVLSSILQLDVIESSFINGDIIINNNVIKYNEIENEIINWILNQPYVSGISISYNVVPKIDYFDKIISCDLTIWVNDYEYDYSTKTIHFNANDRIKCITKICLYLLNNNRLNNIILEG